MSDFHAAVIGGTHSGAGKTTWSLALMGYFQKKGRAVQPFKVGPDYIDPGFHDRICHPRKSRNLDRFFLSENYLKNLFTVHGSGAEIAFIEGVMGLFDGRDPLSEEGSTAQMAKLLGLPVFLVIDAAGLSRSAAAIVKGYQSFDPGLNLKGIFLNRVGSEGHVRWLKEPIEKETGIPVLGWLPKEEKVGIPERHLGLRSVLEEEKIQEKFNRLAEMLEGRFDEKRFLAACALSERRGAPCGRPIASNGRAQGPPLHYDSSLRSDKSCRIGIAYDSAFSFYYADNFDLLREAGAELVFFSPLADMSLPAELDALYFGGGFPEIFSEKLSCNKTMIESIHRFHGEGGLIYAECGGLMYLAESLSDSQGRTFPLAGLVPGEVRMGDRLQNFGYHEIEGLTDTFLSPAGKKLRSHEFHYSLWQNEGNFSRAYRISGRIEGFYDGRLLASYQHLHFGQDPLLAKNFVTAAESRRAKACRS